MNLRKYLYFINHYQNHSWILLAHKSLPTQECWKTLGNKCLMKWSSICFRLSVCSSLLSAIRIKTKWNFNKLKCGEICENGKWSGITHEFVHLNVSKGKIQPKSNLKSLKFFVESRHQLHDATPSQHDEIPFYSGNQPKTRHSTSNYDWNKTCAVV